LTGYSIKGTITFWLIVAGILFALLAGDIDEAFGFFVMLILGVFLYQAGRWIVRIITGYDPDDGSTKDDRYQSITDSIPNEKNNIEDLKTQLQELKDLFESNLITEDEYNIKKKHILALDNKTSKVTKIIQEETTGYNYNQKDKKSKQIHTSYEDFDSATHFNRGKEKTALKDFDGAIKEYSQAIEKNSNNANAFYNRGLLKRNLGDYTGAIDDYTKAIGINNKDFHAFNNRAIAKYLINDKIGAIRDFSKSGELGNADAYKWINKIKQELNK
jgi:tetratricopeptide (TPR) repeat protein